MASILTSHLGLSGLPAEAGYTTGCAVLAETDRTDLPIVSAALDTAVPSAAGEADDGGGAGPTPDGKTGMR